MTFYSNDWVQYQGVRNCFFVIGGITVFVTLLTIPMYIWGKRGQKLRRQATMGSNVMNTEVAGAGIEKPGRVI